MLIRDNSVGIIVGRDNHGPADELDHVRHVITEGDRLLAHVDAGLEEMHRILREMADLATA
ncbi:hypothetical protein SAMN05421505_16210 [Sinosporangium album]|uniref:Uncharacterized protein n=1 Tax=Sinosporangium album TaxID=504805 RepID=A0A1G8L6D4_9ACTN|nr:hypothetical protein [Sinosporangium album]SDI51246.1 hypothetical protein SAMN05421505_16210 [Sinosporangium album]